MLRMLRVRAWCVVAAVCLAVSTAGASFDALLHEPDTHDACCAPAFSGPHDPDAHRYREAGGPGHEAGAEHCLVCHWARSFRHGAQDAPSTARLADAGASDPARSIGRALSPALAGLPARSPPRLS